jgi:large subunit ribosomal protein L24e
MVVKRQCSFCAREIEPGTGTMFVKRDGTVFHFCSSSCRKQQLTLGRVGHRFKWTRAHALKQATERAPAAAPPAAPTPPSSTGARRTEPPPPEDGSPPPVSPAPAASPASAPEPTPKASSTPRKSRQTRSRPASET